MTTISYRLKDYVWDVIRIKFVQDYYSYIEAPPPVGAYFEVKTFAQSMLGPMTQYPVEEVRE